MHKPDRKEEAREEERIWLIQRDAQKEGLRWDPENRGTGQRWKRVSFPSCMHA